MIAQHIDLDVLQAEVELLLALLRNRQLGLYTWNRLLCEHIEIIDALISPKELSLKIRVFDVRLNGKRIDRLFTRDQHITITEVKQQLVFHDHYDPNIELKEVDPTL